MEVSSGIATVGRLAALAPALLLGLAALAPHWRPLRLAGAWRLFARVSWTALAASLVALAAGEGSSPASGWLQATTAGLMVAALVQVLGTVIAAFSARYLKGEGGQRRYLSAFAAVLAAVHLLLLANHWIMLLLAWAAVGEALRHLLCFYPERPFARLAAHKKRLADRAADVFLVLAAVLAWSDVGSGEFPALWSHVAMHGPSPTLQVCALLLALAVILRTALLPVHGWLTQVMEAPTPVSALLHAGVVNLGGFVLIRFAPLLEHAPAARATLVAFGLGTAVLAALVMLTRVSIKLRLAWSTVAQMGFMVLECGLGLYTLALLHLVGHSLYKAQAFLAASGVVRETRRRRMRGSAGVGVASLWLAPLAATCVTFVVGTMTAAAWPAWWSLVLGLAWAPVLWLPPLRRAGSGAATTLGSGLGMLALLAGLAAALHRVPLGVGDAPDAGLGTVAVAGMAALYLCLALSQHRPAWLRGLRRWSYAGFYLDEAATRLALRWWPSRWTPASREAGEEDSAPSAIAAMAAAVATDVDFDAARVDAACEQACAAIAPCWPLDAAIAVNPHWSRVGLPLRRVAARMAVLGRIQVFPSRERQRRAWESGRIEARDLALALARLPGLQAAGLNGARCIEALRLPPTLTQLPLLIDLLDDDPARHARLSWRQAITHQVSQVCAAYFDHEQADWQPDRAQGLFRFWRETLQHDHGIGQLMGLPGLGAALGALPATRAEAEHWVFRRLGLPPEAWADYLEAVLLTVNGWASWCAYLGWQARLQGGRDEHLRELLAIRLAWGAVLLECKHDAAADAAFAALRAAWRDPAAVIAEAEHSLRVDEAWQLALEIGYQRGLAGALAMAEATAPTVEVQAAFCIDVRSEPLRRALERACPSLQTIGFAGFFGLPLAYTPLGTTARRPQLPGLLAPGIEVRDCVAAGAGEPDAAATRQAAGARHQRFAAAAPWRGASHWPGAAFAFVEAAGAGYLAGLGQWLRPGVAPRSQDDLAGLPARHRTQCRPRLHGMEPAAKVDMAAAVLHAMGLDRGVAPLVLLVGHGSQTRNNAQAAALDCGACCGQTGEVNARALAQLLNEPAVRAGLRGRGIAIADEACFVAGLHNTTTDEIEGFDLDLLPPAARRRWEACQGAFAVAGAEVRRGRAPGLGLPDEPDLRESLRRRGNDGAQVRPEWGLANNAAFVIAPRARTRGLDLQGRCFLHDFDAANDADGRVLELLLTAPMLVTHWINWQYHASTCEPRRLGSGNKLLHNVVGGTIGVFEGNGGDLRIGLSRQSLHDGRDWRHEPLRLTVVVDAPAAAIERVLGAHAVVRDLVANGWLHLWRFDAREQLQRYERGAWIGLGDLRGNGSAQRQHQAQARDGLHAAGVVALPTEAELEGARLVELEVAPRQ